MAKVIEGKISELGENAFGGKRDYFVVSTGEVDMFGDEETNIIWHDVKPEPHLTANLKIGDRVRCVVDKMGMISWSLISINVFDD